MTEPIRVLQFADVHVGMENFERLDAGSASEPPAISTNLPI